MKTKAGGQMLPCCGDNPPHSSEAEWPSAHAHAGMTFLLSGQGQFNFVHVIITPLDYKCNLLTLQCRKGEAKLGRVAVSA